MRHRESRLAGPVKRGGKIAEYVDRSMKSWKVYHFHDTSSSARIKLAGDLDDNAFLRPDASNLAAFLYWLQDAHPGDYEQIVERQSDEMSDAPWTPKRVIAPVSASITEYPSTS